MARLKVLHLIKSLGRGGAETLLSETLENHDAMFEFSVAYFLPWKNQLVETIEKGGNKVVCFAASNNLLILFRLFQIKRYCIEHKIDLIHCHLPWAGFVGRLLFKSLGIPVMYTEHNVQERYHSLTRFLNKITFNWQSTVVAVSRDVKQSIIKNIVPAIEVVTVPNGVNTSKFQRDAGSGKALKQTFNIPATSLVIGTIAVFRFQKRLIEWLTVAAEVNSKFPDVYFVIVGDGPLNQQIRSEVERLGIAHRVIMPGLQQDVKPWLSLMDIYMMTSEFEGMPIALLEAMSMGCGIVTTNAGGIKEVVRHDQEGYVVEVDHWRALLPALEKLITHPDQLMKFKTASRQRVLDSFSLQRMVTQVEALYLQITQTATV